MTSTPDLPVRSIGDERLAELLTPGGCPLCRLRLRAGDRFLEAILYESVNDRGFRADLDRGRGFCRPHARRVLEVGRARSGSSLGAVILLGAVTAQRAAELEAAADPTGRRAARRAFDAIRQDADCPVCARVSGACEAAVARLLELIEDPAWRVALGDSELCCADLVLFWQASGAAGAAAWSPVIAAQRARVAGLASRLRSFAYNSSYDRRHLLTDEERGAADEAARFLGGEPSEPG